MITVPLPRRTRITATAQDALETEGEALPRLYVVVTLISEDGEQIEDVRRVFGAEGVICVLEKLRHEYEQESEVAEFFYTVCLNQSEFPDEQ